MDNGIPCRFPTQTQIVHHRVPLLIYDDFGVHGNKADTQHSTAWDIFKGGSDAIGTDVGVILFTMVRANEATSQLQGKYNGIVTLETKGQFTYNRVKWIEDFYGYRTKIKKILTEKGEFDPVPKEVYERYDVERHTILAEVKQRMRDAMSTDNIDRILKLLHKEDEELLRLIYNKGTIKFDEAYKTPIARCRSRDLIIAIPDANKHVQYDLTQLGRDTLMAIDSDDRIETKISMRSQKTERSKY